MSDTSSEPAKQKPEKAGKFSRILEWLAYPLAIVTGGYYGHTYARNSVYDSFKKTEEFQNTLRNTHHQSLENIVASSASDTPLKVAVENMAYDVKVGNFFKKRGFNYTWDYLGALNHKQRLETAMTALTAAGITLGVVLSVANSKELLERLTRREKKSSDQTERS